MQATLTWAITLMAGGLAFGIAMTRMRRRMGQSPESPGARFSPASLAVLGAFAVAAIAVPELILSLSHSKSGEGEFVDTCVSAYGGEGARSMCDCFVSNLESRYSEKDLKKLADDVAKGDTSGLSDASQWAAECAKTYEGTTYPQPFRDGLVASCKKGLAKSTMISDVDKVCSCFATSIETRFTVQEVVNGSAVQQMKEDPRISLDIMSGCTTQ